MSEEEGLVYFVLDASRNEQRVKIGTTRHLADRLKQLRGQTLTRQEPLLLALLGGGVHQERWLHQAWARYRIGGEWFSYQTELREFIQELENPIGWLLDRPSMWQFARGFCALPEVNLNSDAWDDRYEVALQRKRAEAIAWLRSQLMLDNAEGRMFGDFEDAAARVGICRAELLHAWDTLDVSGGYRLWVQENMFEQISHTAELESQADA